MQSRTLEYSVWAEYQALHLESWGTLSPEFQDAAARLHCGSADSGCRLWGANLAPLRDPGLENKAPPEFGP